MSAFNIVIDHTKVDEDLYDFPILVNIDTNSGISDIDTTSIFTLTDTKKLVVNYLAAVDLRPDTVDDDFVGLDGDVPSTDLWYDSRFPFPLPELLNDQVVMECTDSLTDRSFGTLYKIRGNFQIELDFDLTGVQRLDTSGIQFHLYEPASGDSLTTQDRTTAARQSRGLITKYISSTSTTLRNESTTTVLVTKIKITRVGQLFSIFYWESGAWVTYLSDTNLNGLYGDLEFAIRTFALVNATLCTWELDNYKLVSGEAIWPVVADTSITSQPCNVEIDRWDGLNQQAQLWVKVPYISKDVNTILNLSFDPNNDDNSEYVGDTGEPGSIPVWSEYDSVWHLSSNAKDSAANAIDGLFVNMDASNIVDFGIGKGLSLNGIDEWVDLGNNVQFDISAIEDVFMEHTLETDQVVNNWRGLQARGSGSGAGTSGWQFGGRNNMDLTYFTPDGAVSNSRFDSTIVFSLNTPYNFAVLFKQSDGELNAYRNGTLILDDVNCIVTGDMTDRSFDVTRNATIGCAWDDAATQSQFMSGKLKEVRFSKKLKTPEWISANYKSINDDLVRFESAQPIILNRLILGSITENLAVTQWHVRAYRVDNGAFVTELVTTDGPFELVIPVGSFVPLSVTVVPDQGVSWVPNKNHLLDELVMPLDPLSTPYYYKCILSGTGVDGVTGTTEPAWPTNVGGTVVDGTITWELAERMVQPITHSPLIAQ